MHVYSSLRCWQDIKYECLEICTSGDDGRQNRQQLLQYCTDLLKWKACWAFPAWRPINILGIKLWDGNALRGPPSKAIYFYPWQGEIYYCWAETFLNHCPGSQTHTLMPFTFRCEEVFFIFFYFNNRFYDQEQWGVCPHQHNWELDCFSDHEMPNKDAVCLLLQNINCNGCNGGL